MKKNCLPLQTTKKWQKIQNVYANNNQMFFDILVMDYHYLFMIRNTIKSSI